MLSTSGRKRSVTPAIDPSFPCTVLTVMPSTEGRFANDAIGGGESLISLPPLNGNSSSRSSPICWIVRNLSPSSAPSSARRSETTWTTVPGHNRCSEAAADAEVERDVEPFGGQQTRTPRRGRHHSDAADQHVDVMSGRLVAGYSRAGLHHARQSCDKRADFGRSGDHDENPH